MSDQLRTDACALDAAYSAAERSRLTNPEECPKCGAHFTPDALDLDLDLGSGILCPTCRDALGGAGRMYGIDCPVCGGQEWIVVVSRCVRATRSTDRILAVCWGCDAETGTGPTIDLGSVR